MDTKKHGNPLVDQALELSVLRPVPDELSRLRGRQPGYAGNGEAQEEAMAARISALEERRAARGKPRGDFGEVDADGNFVGYQLGDQQVDEEAPGEGGAVNGPGSFESFMLMFGGGGMPPPGMGPVPQ
jgi:hypothetical protein